MKPRNALIAGTLAVLIALIGFVSVQKKIDKVRKNGEMANSALIERTQELENSLAESEKEKVELNTQLGFLFNALGMDLAGLIDQNTVLAEQNEDLREEVKKLREDFVAYQNKITKIYSEATYLTHIAVDGASASNPEQKMKWYLSGSIIQHNGQLYVLTAAHLHNETRTISKITVGFNHGASSQEAEIWGYDHNYDVMLLKFKDPNFKYEGKTPAFADKDQVPVGTRVVAMGSPLTVPYTLSAGYIGKKQKDSPSTRELLIHDAMINPGNSGGPLLNEDGLLVGINVMTGGHPTNNLVTPMYFAVSVRSIREVIDSLAKGEKN